MHTVVLILFAAHVTLLSLSNLAQIGVLGKVLKFSSQLDPPTYLHADMGRYRQCVVVVVVLEQSGIKLQHNLPHHHHISSHTDPVIKTQSHMAGKTFLFSELHTLDMMNL